LKKQGIFVPILIFFGIFVYFAILVGVGQIEADLITINQRPPALLVVADL
jgi:hypothetical protein